VPEPDFFDRIRNGFETVAGQARHVSIDHGRLQAYADELPGKPLESVFDPAHHYVGGNDEALASYVLCLDAVNFGSGYLPDLLAEGWTLIDGSIYYALSTRLKDRFEKQGAFTPKQLQQIAAADCAALFALPDGAAGREFAGLCAAALRELGAGVGESFLSFVGKTNGSAARLAQNLGQLPHFHDVASYCGAEIPFYKRAQIAAADLHLAFRQRGVTLFGDIGRLTMFADNGVPHVLYVDGVLKYDGGLAERIAAEREIPAGSGAEIEIRACAGHAVELIAARKNMTAMDIDHILWHRSASDPRYAQTPPHVTKTVYY
jgi:hypothetical protein